MYDVIIVGARCGGSPSAMLLARQGYRVLLLDRSVFPSDVLSTHLIWQSGVARLKRWGLLEPVADSGCPAITQGTYDRGDFPLVGWGPPAGDVAASYCPRRKVLDTILVEAAVEAGAEFWDGFTVQEVIQDGDRIVGVRGRGKSGATTTVHGKIIVGADGRNSLVARAVKAPHYHERPTLDFYYYAYWSDVEPNGYELYTRNGRMIQVSPTNDGLLCIGVGAAAHEFREFRADVEGNYLSTIDSATEVAQRIRAGRRVERIVGVAELPNYFRRPYGPGWALVGDAGYHRDPILASGIGDAFRDAELLAEAIDGGLSGNRPLSEALGAYEQKRNQAALPIYELTQVVAYFGPISPDEARLRAALRGNQAKIDRLFGVLAGTVGFAEFFSSTKLWQAPAPAVGVDTTRTRHPLSQSLKR